MSDVSTNGTPIAVLKMVNPDTGEATLVYVKTCTEAVVCPDGKTAQEHLAAIYGHIADGGIHLTVEQKANMETKAGAQEKADNAKQAAISAASLFAQSVRAAASNDATQKANAARDAAYKYTDELQKVLNQHSENQSNPHNVTAAQVGLGNVPNKSTNDQQPTFTEASALSELTSGEKLTLMLGKIATAIKTLISHVGNKLNPHGVTAAQTGAVPTKGGTMTGNLSFNGGHIILKEGVNYGTTLPTAGSKGRVFFKVVN
jgi:hypothetical protein